MVLFLWPGCLTSFSFSCFSNFGCGYGRATGSGNSGCSGGFGGDFFVGGGCVHWGDDSGVGHKLRGACVAVRWLLQCAIYVGGWWVSGIMFLIYFVASW